MNNKKKFALWLGLIQVLLVLVAFLTVNALIPYASAQTQDFDTGTSMILALSAAIAVSSAVLGSAWAIKTVGTAAISALTEREGSFGQLLVLVALAEALAVYGLIVGILLWTKIP